MKAWFDHPLVSSRFNVMASPRYERIYTEIRGIPRGRVATYGQIAALCDLEGHARQVGYALNALPDESVPWHRVVNARGEVSPRTRGDSHELQRLLLEAEGVVFDDRGRIDLERFQWRKTARPRHPVRSPSS